MAADSIGRGRERLRGRGWELFEVVPEGLSKRASFGSQVAIDGVVAISGDTLLLGDSDRHGKGRVYFIHLDDDFPAPAAR